MRSKVLAFGLCVAMTAAAGLAVLAAPSLATIARAIAPIGQETELRRNIAQATFCLPQNVLGILVYTALSVTGDVVESIKMNETTVVVTKTPLGASLGRFLFLGEALLSEDSLRHEYGHTLQGYRHGPFYLLFEGTTSFVQAAISLVVPSFAVGYFDRWPENEANALGGVPARTDGKDD